MNTNNEEMSTDYLTPEAVEIFMRANVLHSIDRGLIKVSYDKVTLTVAKINTVFKVDLRVEATKEKKGFVTRFDFTNCSDQDMALRRMMGVAMQVLDTLNHYDHNKKTPIIKVVK